MPTLVIDGRWINEEMSGIGRYTLGLLGGLAELDHDLRVVVLGGRFELLIDAIGRERSQRLAYLSAKRAPLALSNQFTLPHLLRKAGADLYHAPYVHAPIRSGRCQTVITVHDLIPLRYPQGLAQSRKVRHRRLWNLWCDAQYRSADAIVTVSDFSKRELLEHARISPRKVHRIYNGVNQTPTSIPTEEVDALRSRWDLRGHVVCYLGRHDPYKNVAGLVQAFARVRSTLDAELTLVIGGKLDSRYPEPRELACALGIQESVIFTDYLDERSRAALLKAADVFVFPSKYEGFGLPPLEAMVEGTPVVASNAASIPEIVGDAAQLIDPGDIQSMADAIVEVLTDEAKRHAMIDAGREQAAKFTWSHCAAEHLALYRRLLQRRVPRRTRRD